MRALLAAVPALALLAACSGKPSDEGQGAQTPARVGEDFALASVNLTLPTDEQEMFPPGPNVDQVNNNCRACHSPSMVLTQPPLTHEEWVKVVDKMRTVFKAPVADSDVAAIVAYLDDFSAKQRSAGPAGGQPEPAAR